MNLNYLTDEEIQKFGLEYTDIFWYTNAFIYGKRAFKVPLPKLNQKIEVYLTEHTFGGDPLPEGQYLLWLKGKKVRYHRGLQYEFGKYEPYFVTLSTYIKVTVEFIRTVALDDPIGFLVSYLYDKFKEAKLPPLDEDARIEWDKVNGHKVGMVENIPIM